METNFTDRLIKRCEETKSHVAVELAPERGRIPEFLVERFESVGALLYAYCKGIVDAVHDVVAAVVIPSYVFEAYGIGGVVAMDAVSKYAASKGMVVILDGEKGGTKDAMENYVRAYLCGDGGEGAEGWFFADALTVSPYSDAEGLKSAAAYCMENGKGLFVNVKTVASKEKVHFENIKAAENEEPIYKSAADDAGEFGRNFVGKNGYGVIGMYVYPSEEGHEIRKINKWGIALVRAQNEQEFANDNYYHYYYEDDGEGSLLVVRDAILYACEENGSEFGKEAYAEAARVAAVAISKKIENKRLV